MAQPSSDLLDFGLNFHEGRGLLGLRGRTLLDPISVDRLEMEIPNLRFPFDVSGGAARFQARRCQLKEARLSVDEERLSRWLRLQRLPAYGVTDLSARVAEGSVHLGFVARVGDHSAQATARAWIEAAGGQRVRVVIGDVRLYAHLAVPAPLWGLALLLGALPAAQASGGAGEAPVLRGVSEVTLNPLALALWHALLPSGWRLPAYRHARIRDVRIGGGRIEIDYDEDRGAHGEAPLVAEAGRTLCWAGEEALAGNSADEALAAFRAAWAQNDHPHLAGRILAILTASASHWDEAVALAKDQEQRRGGPGPQLALAAIEAARGDEAAAAIRYQQLANLAEQAGELEDQLAALSRASSLFGRADPPRATPLYERILSLPPSLRGRADLGKATEQLAERYAAEKRWEDLAQLERKRIALAPDRIAQASGHVRLATVWLDHLGDAARARDELERAVKLDGNDGDAWSALSRAHAALGDRQRALAAIDKMVTVEREAGRTVAAAAAEVRAAGLLGGGGEEAAALDRLRAATALDPVCFDAFLAEARLLARLARPAEADGAFEKALAALSPDLRDDGARRELLLEWAALARARSDGNLARRLLGRAADLGDDRRVLAAVAELADVEGRGDDAERALGRLAALGDTDALLRRARALLALGRSVEARAIAQSIEAESPSHRGEAARLTADACRAAGDEPAYRVALEHLLEVDPARADRPEISLELGLAALAAGDLDGADRHLAGAGEGRAALAARCDVLAKKGSDAALAGALGRLALALVDDPPAGARALTAQGAAWSRLAQTEEAIDSYRRAVTLDGENLPARAGLGETAWALHLWDEARFAWEPLYHRGFEPRAQLALRLGAIAERQGDIAGARTFYRGALERGASGQEAVRAHNAIVALHEGRGESEEAARAMLDAADDPHTDESDTARANRLVGAANLLRRRAGRADDALGIYERSLALDPLHLGALDALESIATQAGDADRIALVLSRKVAATKGRPHDQKAILARLATVQNDLLGRPDAAAEAHRRALELDPGYRPSLTFLAGAARVAGDAAEETRLLDRLARLPGDPVAPEVDVEIHARLSALYLEQGRPVEAEREARRALDLSPRHPGALEVLDDLFTRAGRHADLEPVLARRAEAETGFERSIGIAYRRASLLEQLGRRDDAVKAYDQIVRLRPTSAAAWERLAALHRDAGAWSELLGVLGRIGERRAAEGELVDASAIFVEMAHLAYDRLTDGTRATRLLERALELDAKSTLAIDGLLMLARAAGDVVAEDALLGRRMLMEEEPSRRDAMAVERARLRRDRLDPEGALALLAEIPLERATDDALRLRVQVAESRGAWSDAAMGWEELAARAHRAGDGDGERAAVRHQARIAWEELRHGRAAETLYRRALELDPDDVAAATALAEVERERGEDADYLEALERLLTALRRRFSSPTREADVCSEIARVLRLHGDSGGAAARLREAIEAEPRRVESQVKLGEVLLERGEAAAAILVLERAVELEPDRATWALLGVAYQSRGDSDKAAAALEAAGDAADPAQRAEALERAGREEEALTAWRAIGGEAGAGNAARILYARAVAAVAGGKAGAAAAWAQMALSEGPCDPHALEIAAVELAEKERWALAERAASRLPSRGAAQLWLVAARILSARDLARAALVRSQEAAPSAEALAALARIDGGAEGAAHARAALALDPGSAEAALALADLARTPDVLPALATAHSRAAPGSRPALSLAAGYALHELGSDPVPRGLPWVDARDAFQRALDDGAEDKVAATARRCLAMIELAAGELGAAERHLTELHASGRATGDDLIQLAELATGRGAHGRAVELLREAEAPSPLLARALESAGRFQELVDLLERSAGEGGDEDGRAVLRHAAAIADGELRDPRRAATLLERAAKLGPADADLWARLGNLYAGPLDDRERAAVCWARASGVDRRRADVILQLGDYHFERGEYDPARDYYERIAELGFDGNRATRGHVQLRLADLAQQRGEASAEEALLYAAADSGDAPSVIAAWSRLAEHYRKSGDDARRAEAILAWAESDPQRRAELLREARALLDPAEAARIDDQLLRLDPADDSARNRVLGRLRAAADDVALARRLSEEAVRAPPALREAMRVELAQVRERLGDHQGAFEAWCEVLAVAPKLEHARKLVWVASRVARGAEAATLVENALGHEGGDVAALVAEALLGPGGDRERAMPFIERAMKSGAASPGSAALRAMWRSTGRFPELVADLDAEAARRSGPTQLALELEAARVVEDDLGDLSAAAARYARVFHRDPSQRDVASRARVLYLAAGDEVRALALLEAEIASAPLTEVASLRVVRAELLVARGPDSYGEAEAELIAALSTAPRSGLAHAALGELRLKLGHLDAALPHLIAAADAPDVDPQRAAASALAAAQHLAARGAHADAERLYTAAARLDAVDERAVLGLISLAAARGNHAQVIELQGRALSLAPDRRTRARLWLDRAKVFRDQLGRDADAYRCLKEAVANDPELLEAASLLRKEAEARGEWSLATELLRRELQAAPEEERGPLHADLGRLLEERMVDLDGALQHLEAASALGTVVWGDLARLYQASGRPRDAAVALAQHAGDLYDEARAETLLRAAELYRRAGAHDEAEALLGLLASQEGGAAREAQSALLRLADDRGDPEALRRALEDRLADPNAIIVGDGRLELQRRLLSVVARLGDDAAVDRVTAEILAHSPADSMAFVERKRVLAARNDLDGLVALLRARADHCGDPAEAAERRFESGRLCEKNGDTIGAAGDYQQALATFPDHHGALDALADLAYRQRDVTRARQLYAQLEGRPSSFGADEVWKRRGELAEAEADFVEARAHYEHAVAENPSLLPAWEALARLAVRRDDPPATFHALKAILELLPLDAVDRITDLRQRLGDLATRVGAPHAARNYYELVIAQHHDRVAALRPLAELYAQNGDWALCADALGRLSYLAEAPLDRADLTYRQAEIHRLHLHDIDRAYSGYLRAADLAPTHLPTLRRLVGYYLAEGDLSAVHEIVEEIEAQGATLGDCSVEAGIAVALSGDLDGAARHLAGAPPADLAAALGTVLVSEAPQLDNALRAAQRALGADAHQLTMSLELRLAEEPSDRGARLVLGRRCDLAGDQRLARAHYSILAWLDPDGPAARRLAQLGPPTPLRGQAIHPATVGPLREALALLGPLALGLVAPRPGALGQPAWATRLAHLGTSLGAPPFSVASIEALDEPALCEPTAPPRLLLRHDLLADAEAVPFAAARALHLLRAGVALVAGRPDEDLSALLAAAAALFDPEVRLTSPFARAWLAELHAVPLRAESLTPAALPVARRALARALLPDVIAGASDFVETEQMTANRVAYLATGDLVAALRVVAFHATTPEQRAAALSDGGPVMDLCAFATGA